MAELQLAGGRPARTRPASAPPGPSCFLATAALLASVGATGEVLVPLPSGGQLGLSTRGPSAFRVRVLLREDRPPVESPLVAPDGADAPFEEVHGSRGRGIRSAFGAATVTPEGSLVLADAGGGVLTQSQPLGLHSCAGLPSTAQVGGISVGASLTTMDEGACCAACSRTPRCTDWVFGIGQKGGHCWLGRSVKRWVHAKGSVAGRSCSVLSLSTRGAKLYGHGAAPKDAKKLTADWVSTFIVNRGTYVPHYYSTDGYAALGIVNTTRHNQFPVTYSTDGKRLSWGHFGAFELYLMPAATLASGTRAYFELTGAPRVPPQYAFGFMASRWGWRDRAYIDETLATFRARRFPIDAFILGFEWFANQSDYDFPPGGEKWYDDFGYNPDTFPAPRAQLSHYHSELKMRMGAIRKPRLGNPAHLSTARSKGWMAPPGGPETYAKGRWLSFLEPAMREWYARQNAHYLDDGVDFWWNDEGENGYFTYHFWNVVQIEMLRASGSPNRRFYSLNRAFTPGMARLGATVWTGDIAATWEDLSRTPGTVLNWGLAGAPYVACDIGGFWGKPGAELLTRWYQVGAFMPMMRVHSTREDTPHWPWLFGDRAAAVMRSALELRYRLLPYHYSLAHAMYLHGQLWMRPLAMDFPDDAVAAELTEQWMDGQILVAPVLRNDSRKRLYLPAGSWYPLGAAGALRGPRHIEGTAAFDEVPAYLPAGALLPLAPAVEHTGELPGGPLELQVYAGVPGAFELVEDDGETQAYEAGDVRVTQFLWDDEAQTLSWKARGFVGNGAAFGEFFVTLFEPGGGMRRSAVMQLGAAGSICLQESQDNCSGSDGRGLSEFVSAGSGLPNLSIAGVFLILVGPRMAPHLWGSEDI